MTTSTDVYLNYVLYSLFFFIIILLAMILYFYGIYRLGEQLQMAIKTEIVGEDEPFISVFCFVLVAQVESTLYTEKNFTMSFFCMT